MIILYTCCIELMSYDLCPPPQLILTIGLFWAVLYNTRSVCIHVWVVCVCGGVLQCEVWNPTTHSPYGTPLLTCPLLGKSDPQSNPFPSQAGGQYCYTLDTPHTHTCTVQQDSSVRADLKINEFLKTSIFAQTVLPAASIAASTVHKASTHLETGDTIGTVHSIRGCWFGGG